MAFARWSAGDLPGSADPILPRAPIRRARRRCFGPFGRGGEAAPLPRAKAIAGTSPRLCPGRLGPDVARPRVHVRRVVGSAASFDRRRLGCHRNGRGKRKRGGKGGGFGRLPPERGRPLGRTLRRRGRDQAGHGEHDFAAGAEICPSGLDGDVGRSDSLCRGNLSRHSLRQSLLESAPRLVGLGAGGFGFLLWHGARVLRPLGGPRAKPHSGRRHERACSSALRLAALRIPEPLDPLRFAVAACSIWPGRKRADAARQGLDCRGPIRVWNPLRGGRNRRRAGERRSDGDWRVRGGRAGRRASRFWRRELGRGSRGRLCDRVCGARGRRRRVVGRTRHRRPTARASAALRSACPVGPSPSFLRASAPWPGPSTSRRYASY